MLLKKLKIKIFSFFCQVFLKFFGVFIIVLISMWYLTIMIKKENILDAIKIGKYIKILIFFINFKKVSVCV